MLASGGRAGIRFSQSVGLLLKFSHRSVSVRSVSTLHVRGLPRKLSESIAYPLFSSYGPLKELFVYSDKHNETNNCAIVTFAERPSAFACLGELHWRPLTLSSNEHYDPNYNNVAAKSRNIVKIEFETENAHQALPEWIQSKRIASRKRIPLYQQIQDLQQTLSQQDTDEDKKMEFETKLKDLQKQLQSPIK